MPIRNQSLRRLAVGGAVLAAAGTLGAQGSSASPFLPPPAAVSNAPTAGAPIEFRGYMESSEGMRFRIFDPTKKSGAWVKLNEHDSNLDVTVKQFSGGDSNETIVVEYQGRTITLQQRTAKIVSSGSAVQNMPPPPPNVTNVPPAVTQAVVVNPTPADEAKRLQSVADEVARRRALREQAAQQQPVPQPAIPQPAPAPQAAPNQQQRPQRR